MAAIWFFSGLPYFLGLVRCPTAQFLHRPCPGCGMSRALTLLWAGEFSRSLSMHPLALPTALVQAAVGIASVVVTLHRGSPFELLKVRYGRVTVYALGVVFALVVALWIARSFGFAGGPVLV